MLAEGGFPAPRIEVLAGATDAHLSLVGPLTNVVGNNAPTISIKADGASLLIGDHASLAEGNGQPPIDMSGNRQILSVSQATLVNWMGTTSIRVSGNDATVSPTGSPRANKSIFDCLINGKVEISGEGHVVSVAHARFSTGSSQGGIAFTGKTLTIDDSEFNVMGVEQEGAYSRATVRNSVFKGYKDFGYLLKQGHLDLGNEAELGGDHFTADAKAFTGDSNNSPVAIHVTAATGANAEATVRGTTFEDQTPPPGVVRGENFCAGFYRIVHDGIPIWFY